MTKNKKNKTPALVGANSGNNARVAAVQDRRQSGSYGKHQGGTRGQRDRSGARRTAIAEQR
jgi:hypothetical protein